MKKIGILYGQERSFPQAFVDQVNAARPAGIVAESVSIDKVIQGVASSYAVLVDRISHDVPFYRAWLKNEALQGAAVINNPFWSSADEKFFNNCLAVRLGVAVPKTALLPSRELPLDTTGESMCNLAYPMDWEGIFSYVGFPAYMKPFAGGGWKHVYRLSSREEFFEKHAETGQLVMMLQEEIEYEEYYRCYCIGGRYVRVMPYEPRNAAHLRYDAHFMPSYERREQIASIVLRLNQHLGYDFNTVELAIRNGVPYAIDFCNPVPDADEQSVGTENFNWVVSTMANYAIERAYAQQPGKDNLTWGGYLKKSAIGL